MYWKKSVIEEVKSIDQMSYQPHIRHIYIYIIKIKKFEKKIVR